MSLDFNEILETIPYFYNKITNYKTWSAVGFALANLGEQGRTVFIDISLNQSYKDTEEQLNREYDRILTKNEGTTKLSTFFYYAKQYGYTGKGKNNTAVPFIPVVMPAKEIDYNLIREKKQFLEMFVLLLSSPGNEYFVKDRCLSRQVVEKAKIKTLSCTLNVRDDNNNLPFNEDGKTIYNLADKRLYTAFLQNFIKSYTDKTTNESTAFLESIGIFSRNTNNNQVYFTQYKLDYIIPCYNSTGELINVQFTTNYKTRETSPEMQKYYFLKKSYGEETPLFYYPAFFREYKPNKPLFITEGIIDALSLATLNLQAISLYTANFTTAGKEQEVSILKGYDIFLLIEDDTAGSGASKKLKELFTGNNINCKLLSVKTLAKNLSISEQVKDINDILKTTA